MRPKHTLWLLVGVLSTTWYFVDPQARPETASLRSPGPDRGNHIAEVRISGSTAQIAAARPPF